MSEWHDRMLADRRIAMAITWGDSLLKPIYAEKAPIIPFVTQLLQLPSPSHST